ncbi:MAG: hypothetical protein NUV63_11120 [Gallionella sp.]|nr:hypothetical protein [Gallionella sp.]
MSMLRKLGAASAAILKTIMAPMVGKNDLCDAIGYTTNAGAPSSVTPDFIGQKLFDTSGAQFYIAYGVAQGEWSPMGDNTLSATELAFLDGAATTNAVADKAAIIGTGGALTLGGIKQAPVFVADATPYAVLAANSGKLHIILEQTNTITLNLPVIAAGLSYKFVMGGVATEAQNWVIVATTPSFYNGGVTWDDSNAVASPVPVYGNGTSHLTLTATTPEAGTEIEIYSNGTEWFVHGAVFSTATPAFT